VPTYDIQFVDSIAAAPGIRLDLSIAPWAALEGTTFGLPELRRAAVSTLLVDGEMYPAAAYGNRMLTLVARVEAVSDDETATALQRLYRELDRPRNILRYRPGTSDPVFFRTFRSGPGTVVWDPVNKQVTAVVPAAPFAYGLKEILPSAVVYNDPAEGTALNANPNFEVDASSWTAVGGTVARSTAQFHEGVASLLVTPNGVTATVEAQAELVPVTAGAPMRASAWVRCAASRNVAVNINWHTAAGVYIPPTSTTTVAVTANTWTLLDMASGALPTAPPTATQARILVTMTGTPPVGHTLHIDEARIRTPGSAGGMCFDLDDIKGDVETPLYLSAPEADIRAGTQLRQSAIAVRRRGTPSAAPFVLQAETMTPGTDTALGAAFDPLMSGSGQNYLRTTFATFATHVGRATMALWPTQSGIDVRGTYRVFARMRKTVSGDDIQVHLLASGQGGYVQINNERVTLWSGTAIRYADLGLVQMPLGVDPVVDGQSGVEIPAQGVGLAVFASRVSGSGNLDLDHLLFVPADDRLVLAKWANTSGASTYVLDSARSMAYTLGPSGEVWSSGGAELTGGPPMVSPGVTNRVTWVADVGRTSDGDVITTRITATPYYWPRFLYAAAVES